MNDEQTESQAKGKRLSANDVADRLDRVVESTNNAMASMAEQIKMIADAVTRPVTRRNELDAAATHGIQEDAAEFNDDGVLERPRLLDVNAPEFKAKAEILRFMDEQVTIQVHDTSERDADQVFQVSVNGRSMVLVRGNSYTLPRYFIEVMARARPVHYANQEYIDQDGVRKVRYPSRRGLRYAFSVLQDSDRGKSWLKNLLAAA